MMPQPIQEVINSLMLPYPMEKIAKGHDGFEELRKYIKHGSEFTKEVAVLLQERADIESTYAKGLARIGSKLAKAAGTGLGSLSDGWKSAALAMEQESELHKNLASGLLEEISKPLKSVVETQNKARKPIEAMVDKAFRNLTDRRAEEYKAKKNAVSCAKEYEKVEDSEVKSGKSKDIAKMEKKSKNSLAAVRKADKDYAESCYKGETSRQDWEFTVSKGSTQMQHLEEDRVKTMQEYLNKYNSHISVLPPKLTRILDHLNETVMAVDLQNDLQIVVREKGVKGARMPEQVLMDCYAEDGQFNMNPVRLRNALQNYLLYIQQMLERDRKGKEGVQKLVDVYKSKPNFADADAQEDVKQRLEQTTFTLNFLEASHYKIAKSLAKVDKRDPPVHKFSQYIETTREKQGHMVSLLKLPMNLALDGNSDYTYSAGSVTSLSTVGDHYSTVEPTYDDDEFETDDFDEFPPLTPIGRCKAVYDYDAVHEDEISIKQGDIISVYEKLADGWWQGELNGEVGIFPSTYVEDIK
ncbi:nostrin-like isoform X1 [Haliotis rubra]|uniref:nostrin-like isoform X1 n=1 Tax=Haliotis rubra TaxID=36100 RepID=UPI001EE4EEA8|nr:nostrin-like isoform X1 [Haliotis rubra]